jgi:hypothetical protein
MDFILGLPKTPTRFHLGGCQSSHKETHFISIKVKDLIDKLAKLYVQNI